MPPLVHGVLRGAWVPPRVQEASFDNSAPCTNEILEVMIVWPSALNALFQPGGEGKWLDRVKGLKDVVRVIRHTKVRKVTVDRSVYKHPRSVCGVDTSLFRDVVHIVGGEIVENKKPSPIECFRILCS